MNKNNDSCKIVLCLPFHLLNMLKSHAQRGHRSDFIIKLLEDHFAGIKKGIKPIDPKRLVSVKHIPILYPAFTQGGIRHLIFNHKKNKFTKCFKKVGHGNKKIVINLDEFEKWANK